MVGKTSEKESFIKKHINVILYTLTGAIGAVTAFIVWYNLTHDVRPRSWFIFWKYYMSILFLWTFPVTIWFIIGGIVDLKKLFKILKEEKVNEQDDGVVRDVTRKK